MTWFYANMSDMNVFLIAYNTYMLTSYEMQFYYVLNVKNDIRIFY